jgi:hypothetical protein
LLEKTGMWAWPVGVASGANQIQVEMFLSVIVADPPVQTSKLT